MRQPASPRLAFVTALVLALTLGLGFATLCAVLGGLAWTLELFSHFRVQLAALALIALIAGLALRHRALILVNVVLLAVNLLAIYPHLMSYIRTPTTIEATGRAIRLLSFNMHGLATDNDKFQALVAAERPDVIILTEIPSDIDLRMSPLQAAYPHRLLTGRASFHEIGLYSRWPIAALETNRSAGVGLPVVSADLCPPASERGACLRVIALHATAPFGAAAALRNRQLDIAARQSASHFGPSVIIGDLNLTPWAPTFTDLLRRAKLTDTSRLRGLEPSWRSGALSGGLGDVLALPIDHALVSDGVAPRANRLGPDLGSDHRPLIVDLQLPDLAQPSF